MPKIREFFVDPDRLVNMGIATSVGSSALTIDLTQDDGSSDPVAGNPTKIGFRSSTATLGEVFVREVTSALTMVIPSTATLGQQDANEHELYIYALDFGGIVELAISERLFDEGLLHTTTALSTGSDSANILYSTTLRSNVPIRIIGKLTNTQTTAGTWASAGTTLQTGFRPDQHKKVQCRAFLSGDQAETTADAEVAVDLNATSFDSHAIWDTSAFTGVIPRDGRYRLTVKAQTAGVSGGETLTVIGNVASTAELTIRGGTQGANPHAYVSTDIDLSAGDVIDMGGIVTTDTVWNFIGNEQATYMEIIEL